MLRKCERVTLGRILQHHPFLSLHLDDEGTRALEELARRWGIGKAEAARQAIFETALRERVRGLAAEVRRLIADPDYVDEAREVSGLMKELRDPVT